MPRRSNLFQRLVAELHTKLEPSWIVSESAMLEDSVTKTPREVDVLMTSTVAGHQLRVAVECRDHKRRADAPWVEAMSTKHDHLPTNKLILWSSSGFSKAAIVKARFLKIETVSQRDALVTDWQSIARQILGGFVKLLEPRFSFVVDVTAPDGGGVRHSAAHEHAIRMVRIKTDVPLDALLARMRAAPELPSLLLDHAPTGAHDYHVVYEPPEDFELLHGTMTLGRIRRVIMSIRTVVSLAPAESRSVRDRDALLTIVSAKLPRGQLEVRLEESPITAPVVVARYCGEPSVDTNSIEWIPPSDGRTRPNLSSKQGVRQSRRAERKVVRKVPRVSPKKGAG